MCKSPRASLGDILHLSTQILHLPHATNTLVWSLLGAKLLIKKLLAIELGTRTLPLVVSIKDYNRLYMLCVT